MARFWPTIFNCARSTSGIFSQFWSDSHEDKGSVWPDSLVLSALSQKKPVSRHRASFRDSTITEYENRLRRHSNPMKVFRYFATLKMKNRAGRWEVFMTPQDFLRSLLPGVRQPEGLTLTRYHLLDEEEAGKWHAEVPKDSIFLKLEDRGLLAFSDYVLLIILLSIPERHVRIGFKLFDLDDNGTVAIGELEQVLLAISMGEASVMKSHLKSHLFGSGLSKKLSINEFLEFQQKLSKEILVLEYEMLLKESSSVITELDFAKVVMAYSRDPSQRRTALQRVKQKFGQEKIGINLEEFMSFFRLVQDVEAMDTALAFHFLAGADIRPATLQHLAHVVAGVKLSPHLTAVIFTIFDHDGDGVIRREEFSKTLRERKNRVLQQKKLRLMSGICILGKCCWRSLPSWKSRKISGV